MVEPLRHRQTKGAATDMFYLTPPRRISTLPDSEVGQRNRDFRSAPESRHHADIAGDPESAISGRMPGRVQASKSALAWQSDLSYKVRHERFACHGA
jgi:hypothetical protein